jgi:hypothetical protein
MALKTPARQSICRPGLFGFLMTGLLQIDHCIEKFDAVEGTLRGLIGSSEFSRHRLGASLEWPENEAG